MTFFPSKQLSNYLKDIGIKKGDSVLIYLPMLMELPISMLACARIGAVHSVMGTWYEVLLLLVNKAKKADALMDR